MLTNSSSDTFKFFKTSTVKFVCFYSSYLHLNFKESNIWKTFSLHIYKSIFFLQSTFEHFLYVFYSYSFLYIFIQHLKIKLMQVEWFIMKIFHIHFYSNFSFTEKFRNSNINKRSKQFYLDFMLNPYLKNIFNICS